MTNIPITFSMQKYARIRYQKWPKWQIREIKVSRKLSVVQYPNLEPLVCSMQQYDKATLDVTSMNATGCRKFNKIL